jgi:GH24 family phage-related lysozyme (muramidase)
LVFNMGSERLQRHDVWTDIAAGDYARVPADILSLGAGGSGIKTRRANEVNMWSNGVYPDQCY